MKEFKHRLSLVMVAYNEEERIEGVLNEYYKEVFSLMPNGSDFIVYLDGPKDHTPDLVKAIAPQIGIKVVHCTRNKGYFNAVKSALSHATNEIVFLSDTSGKHNAKDFWKMAPLIDEYDIVTGLRSNREDTLYRRVLSIVQRLFVSALFLMPLFDFNTGFKLIRKTVLDTTLEECVTLPITFSTELIIRAYKRGYRIINCPVSFTHRGGKEKQFAPMNLPDIFFRQMKGFIKLRFQLL